MPKNEFVKEHQRLVRILKKGTKKQQLAEAREQLEELRKKKGNHN